MGYDLTLIKNKYGEKMMKLCRELFPTLLEKEGLLASILLERFEPSHFLCDDIVGNTINLCGDIIENDLTDEFKNYIYSHIDVENNMELVLVSKTPEELLEEAGYILYECKTEEDIQAFKKYYASGEELCTFRNERLKTCSVFFAVKKNADEIRRENFQEPKRQDEYGTSVISIQFTRGVNNTLSIKNRYNHSVNNPDATFSNNLDNIITGLNQSFKTEYGFQFEENKKAFEIPNYVKAKDGKYYKYNYEINNIYYCPNNVIIDNFEAKHYPKESYLVLDYFLIDLKNKKITCYDEKIKDSFPDSFKEIERITVIKKGQNKEIKIIEKNTGNEITIIMDHLNQMISYTNPQLAEVRDHFLENNKNLAEISLPMAQKIGNGFLRHNAILEKISLPQVKEIEDDFLEDNRALKEISLHMAQKIGNGFLRYNVILEKISLPQVKEIGDNFLEYNGALKEISLPTAQKIGNGFLRYNKVLEKIFLPRVVEIGDGFLYNNIALLEILLPLVQKIGNKSFGYNEILKRIYLPQAQEIGKGFLESNKIVDLSSISCLENKEGKSI